METTSLETCSMLLGPVGFGGFERMFQTVLDESSGLECLNRDTCHKGQGSYGRNVKEVKNLKYSHLGLNLLFCPYKGHYEFTVC